MRNAYRRSFGEYSSLAVSSSTRGSRFSPGGQLLERSGDMIRVAWALPTQLSGDGVRGSSSIVAEDTSETCLQTQDVSSWSGAAARNVFWVPHEESLSVSQVLAIPLLVFL